MTAALSGAPQVRTDQGVYAPQDDSYLLVDVMTQSVRVAGARVLDLCTGSGFVGIQAAVLAAGSVTAFDARLGLRRALAAGPYDLVVCNAPYVPHLARNAGAGDGRLVLDPLCDSAQDLLASGGTMLVVQSDFAAPQRSLDQLRAKGLRAGVAAEKWIPFGPEVSAREKWLQRTNRLPIGRREEKLVVIRADKR